jgi:HD-like signal output (HDOD) protein
MPLMLKRFRTMAVLEEAYASAGDERRVVDTENRVLNTNHAVVGYFTARPGACRSTSARPSPTTTTRSVFSDESSRDTQLKNLLAILKMAEHICARTGCWATSRKDHEWESIRSKVLDYVGLTEYEFENLKSSILELGVGRAVTDSADMKSRALPGCPPRHGAHPRSAERSGRSGRFSRACR